MPTYRSWPFPRASLSIVLVLVFLFLVAGDRRASAQASTATVRGVVVDPDARVVPKATVFLTSQGTGQQRTAITDTAGRFTFALVPPSTYTIEATADALSPSHVSALTLNVGDELAVTLELRLPGVEAVVDVRAEGSRIQESPAVGTVIDRGFVENMPLSGRTFQSLFDLTPGVLRSGVGNGQFVVNGQRADANSFLREVQQEVWSGSDERILAAFFDEHRDIDPAAVGSLERFMIYQMRAIFEAEARVQPIKQRYERDRAAQAGFLDAARFLSPALMLQHAFEEAAGAGSERRSRFNAQLAQYVTNWRAYFIPKIYYRVPIRDLSKTPRFRFIEEDAGEITRTVALDIMLLLLAGAGCIAMARRTYRQTSVM